MIICSLFYEKGHSYLSKINSALFYTESKIYMHTWYVDVRLYLVY